MRSPDASHVLASGKRAKGRWTATFVTAHLGEGILLLMGRRSREFRPVPLSAVVPVK